MRLAADIGGTQSRFALFDGQPSGDPAFLRVYDSAAFASLESAFEAFVADAGASLSALERIGLAVAGPVEGRRARLTNLPWNIDADVWQAQLKVAVLLHNDFAAVAHGAAFSPEDTKSPLQHQSDDSALQAFVGAGTGLGVCFRFGKNAFAGEGGHAEFAPRDAFEDSLAQALRQGSQRATVENVVSGPGLLRLARHCARRPNLGIEISPALSDALEADGPAALSENIADPNARMILERFVSIFGSEAGNIALRAVPKGGVFLAGGIAPKLRSALGAECFDATFLRAFADKKPMQGLLENLPVVLLTDPLVGLRGAVA